MKCTNCGAELPDGSGFCTNCGAKIAQQQSQPQQQAQPQQAQYVVKQTVVQPKAKVGIAVGLVAAGMFFMGMFSSVALVLIAGYVLLKEEDNWLRKCAIRSVGTVLMFAAFTGIINVGFDVFRVMNTMAGWNTSVRAFSIIISLESIVDYVLDGFEAILLFTMGVKALSLKTVRIPVLDNLLDRYMN